MIRILIADGNDEFRRCLSDSLRDDFQVYACSTGKQALAIVRQHDPQLLILDLMIPELDGISLLHRLGESGHRPSVLATTRFLSSYVASHSNQLGIEYIVIKPCDIDATASRVRDLAGRLESEKEEVNADCGRISELLIRLGIPAKLQGFEMLRVSIQETILNPGMSITKELYPKVAAATGFTAVQVERSIRTAIAKGAQVGDAKLWQLLFPAALVQTGKCPSNGVFIATVAEFLRTEGK